MWEEGENGQRKSVQGTRERDPNSCRLVQLTTEFIFEKKKKNNKKLGKRKLSYFSFETSQFRTVAQVAGQSAFAFFPDSSSFL
ncbi:hypothetical protein OUZ56_000133 [Daphnia magna]|uniref:Uncharacterized protein n=1 Tax=Daphnia magna TaxID=35525 RepID=A0ABQ9ZYT3_9CRUS|nr:hypothetical protein OUZ56_000133 [Daphnia magna]